MMSLTNIVLKLFFSILFLFLFCANCFSKTVEVGMWSNFQGKKNNMRYDPRIISINVGDTVFWKSLGKDHNVEFIVEGIPVGVEKLNSELNQDVEFTFITPGIYAYVCTLHINIGMIGFVVVGNDLHNLKEVKKIKYSGFARRIAKELIEEIEQNYGD